MSLFDSVDEMEQDILPREASSHLLDLAWLARRYYAIALRMHPQLSRATVIKRASDDLAHALQALAVEMTRDEGKRHE